MRLLSRVGRLERTARDKPPPRCPACGVPEGWVPHVRWVDDLGADLEPVCPRCGFPLDASGEALMSAPSTVRTATFVLARTCPT